MGFKRLGRLCPRQALAGESTSEPGAMVPQVGKLGLLLAAATAILAQQHKHRAYRSTL